MQSPLAGPFTLQVRPGECACVMGPSGSGKSLFLRMIADLDVSQGEVTLGGRSRAEFPAPSWRRLVTYVPAEAGWWADGVRAHFPADELGRATALASSLGLPATSIDSPIALLSTGERQRLALVRALVMDPPVLLLDEPTGALDPASVAAVEALLRERLAAGRCMILVTHDMALGARLATERYDMSKGRLTAS